MAALWLFELITWAYFQLTPISHQFGMFWETVILISFSLIGQGLIIYILYYIKKKTFKYNESVVWGKYHIHEGFYGLVFIIIALILLLIHINLLFLEDILWKRLIIILWFVQVSSFILLFLGSFFFFRDWDDVVKLKFIEKRIFKGDELINYENTGFNQIRKEDIHFFEFPKLMLYPFGILLTIFALNAVVYDVDFLPYEIFGLESEIIIYIGYFCCFAAGGMIGRDWLRLFRKVYPVIYTNIEKAIKSLKA